MGSLHAPASILWRGCFTQLRPAISCETNEQMRHGGQALTCQLEVTEHILRLQSCLHGDLLQRTRTQRQGCHVKMRDERYDREKMRVLSPPELAHKSFVNAFGLAPITNSSLKLTHIQPNLNRPNPYPNNIVDLSHGRKRR